jgi:hypothetical protein
MATATKKLTTNKRKLAKAIYFMGSGKQTQGFIFSQLSSQDGLDGFNQDVIRRAQEWVANYEAGL